VNKTCKSIHFVVCLATGFKPFPQRVLHRVLPTSSSFKLQCPVVSLRPSCSWLRLLPCLPIFPSIFPPVACFTRQLLRKMWPIQLAYLLFVVCRMFVLLDSIWEGLSWKINNAIVFPFDFHIAVQRPVQALWSRQLLYDHEPSAGSFALCFKSLLMSLLPAPGGFESVFLRLCISFRLVLSGLGYPAGNNNTTSLSLRVTATHNPL
jgi:hypothetical protein